MPTAKESHSNPDKICIHIDYVHHPNAHPKYVLDHVPSYYYIHPRTKRPKYEKSIHTHKQTHTQESSMNPQSLHISLLDFPGGTLHLLIGLLPPALGTRELRPRARGGQRNHDLRGTLIPCGMRSCGRKTQPIGFHAARESRVVVRGLGCRGLRSRLPTGVIRPEGFVGQLSAGFWEGRR